MIRFYSTRNLLLSAIALITIICINGCSKGGGSNPTPKASVTITALSITQGSYYSLVNITGTGFDPINGQVFFNGKPATIYTGTTTQITVYVPLAAGTGNVTVIVNGITATGPVFTYVPALVVSTLAGNSFQKGTTDGTGSAARFNQLSGLAIDKNGNLYATDILNYNIRKITPQGVVTTMAGTGKAGSSDGPVSTATFQMPTNLAVDQQGDIYVADNGSLREITTAGNVTTIALKSASSVQAVAIDASNNLYILNLNNTGSSVGKVASDGTVTIIASHFTNPWGLTADQNGNLFVSDGGVIWKIAATSNAMSQFAGQSGGIWKGLAFDSQGNLFVADFLDKYINKVTSTGTISIYAGNSESGSPSDGVANMASFLFPTSVVADASGNIFVADVSAIREISFQ
jgi:NHL repeat